MITTAKGTVLNLPVFPLYQVTLMELLSNARNIIMMI